MVDDTGRRSGRGAYLCRRRDCWETALARQQLAHALKVRLTAEAQAQLEEYAAGLPQLPTVESEGSEGTAKGVSGDG
jgi:predicted RNA-binding protein YlxR (DUF448 family)